MGESWRRVGLLSAGLAALVLGAGFAFPGERARLLDALDAAETTRDRRDALRRLRALTDVQPSDQPLAPLERALGDADPAVRVDALAAHAVSCTRLEPLRHALDDGAADVRAAALALLAERTALDERVLVRACRDIDPGVRIACVRALHALAPALQKQLLAATRDDASLEVRREVVRAWGALADAEARAALRATADDPVPELRAAATAALADLPAASRDAQVTRTLYAALDDSDELVILAALRGLAGASALPRARLERLRLGSSRRVAEAADRLLTGTAAPTGDDPPWLAPLEQTALPHTEAEAYALVDALEATLPAGETLAADPLVAYLAHAQAPLWARLAALVHRSGGVVREADLPNPPDATLSQRCARTTLLAHATGPAVIPTLLAQLDDPRPQLRGASIDALAQVADVAAVRGIVAALEARRDARRLPWLAALSGALPRAHGALDARMRRRLVRLLTDDLARADDAAAAHALSALGWIDEPRARALLRDAARTSPPLRVIAAVRATLPDRSPEARSLRRALRGHADPRIAATALVTGALADDVLSLLDLLAAPTSATWPLGPARAFAIATALARAPTRDPAIGAALCEALRTREPIARANFVAALQWHAEASCADDVLARDLSAHPAWPLRFSAAHAARVRTARAPLSAALAACAQHETNTRVRAVCSGQSRGAHTPFAQPVTAPAKALVLADGRIVIAIADASGDTRWPLAAIDSLNAWFEPYAPE